MGATYYIQVCPTCGRRLEIKIEYIGLEVSCYHCRARFVAESSFPRFMPDVHARSQNPVAISYPAQPSAEGMVAFF